MHSATRSAVRGTRLSNHPSRRRVIRRLTLWLSLTAIGVSVFGSSMLPASRRPGGRPPTTVARAQSAKAVERKQSAWPFAESLNSSKSVTPRASRSLPRSEREIAAAEAELLVDPPATAVRSSMAPTSLSMPGERSNNSDAAKQQPSPAGSLQGELQAENRSQEGQRATQAKRRTSHQGAPVRRRSAPISRALNRCSASGQNWRGRSRIRCSLRHIRDATVHACDRRAERTCAGAAQRL